MRAVPCIDPQDTILRLLNCCIEKCPALYNHITQLDDLECDNNTVDFMMFYLSAKVVKNICFLINLFINALVLKYLL